MKKTLLTLLILSGLFCGCGSSSVDPVSTVGFRNNVVRVTDPTPDLVVDGDPVTLARLVAYDAQDNLVYGPVEEPYDSDISFGGLPLNAARVDVDFERAQGRTLARFSSAVNFLTDDDGVITFDQVSPKLLGGTPSTFTVRVVNNSDYPADQVYLCVLGKDKADTAFYYLQFGANGQATAKPFGSTADYDKHSTALSSLLKESDKEYSFQCPYDKLYSGRIYLSFGKKLQGLGIVNGGGPKDLQTPSASGAPDYQTPYEFMELSATVQDTPGSEYILYANTSVVDFFSVGLGMQLNYHDDTTESQKTESVGFVDNARQQVLAAFQDAGTPAEFKKFIIKDGTATILRVLAPPQSVPIDPNGNTAHFLDSAIDAGWTHYAANVLNIPDTLVNPYGYQYTGQLIVNSILSMTCTAKPGGDTAGGDLESLGETSNLPKPTSRIIFFCDDDQPQAPGTPNRNTWRNDGSQGHKRLCSLLSAAINRGVFENYADWNNSAKFFTRPDGKYNHYAKIMHQFALNGKVYGFGYDDVYGQDPTLVERMSKVNEVVIKIPAFPKF